MSIVVPKIESCGNVLLSELRVNFMNRTIAR